MTREEIRELLKSNLEYFADNPDQLNGVIMNIEAGFDRYAYAVALECLPDEWPVEGEKDPWRNEKSGFANCRATFLANIKAKTNQ